MNITLPSEVIAQLKERCRTENKTMTQVLREVVTTREPIAKPEQPEWTVDAPSQKVRAFPHDTWAVIAGWQEAETITPNLAVTVRDPKGEPVAVFPGRGK